jgi:DNA polymerase III delta prime subunit
MYLKLAPIFLIGSPMDATRPQLATRPANVASLPAEFKLVPKQEEAILQWFHHTGRIALLQGPPGTGKTTTIAKGLMALKRFVLPANPGFKVLCLAPTHVAVNEMTDAALNVFHEFGEPTIDHVVRAYSEHQNKVQLMGTSSHSEQVDEHTMSATRLRVAQANPKVYRSYLDGWIEYSEGYDIENDSVRKAFNFSQKSLNKTALNRATFVFACLTSSDMPSLIKNFVADIIIVDEGCYARDIEVIQALVHHNPRLLVMAGDPQQLGAFMQSWAASRLWCPFMMEKMMHKGVPYVMLEDVFRAPQCLINHFSEAFYDNKLRAHPSTENRPDYQRISANIRRFVLSDSHGTEHRINDRASHQRPSPILRSADLRGCKRLHGILGKPLRGGNDQQVRQNPLAHWHSFTLDPSCLGLQ